MAERAVKRRKKEHSVSNEEHEDDSSFASFGEDSEVDQQDKSESEDDLMSDGSEDERMLNHMNDSSRAEEKTDKSTPQHRKTVSRKDGPGTTSAPYVAGNHKSTVFKLQLDELLEQLRPRRGKRDTLAEEALHRLKSVIESIPDRNPLSVADAERQLYKSSKVRIPFPDPRPPKDAKYKLEYSKPASVNVVGSHVLKTSNRSRKLLEIDMVVTMPPSMFQDKDYLDYRYFYKRAYYIASIAAGLKEAVGAQYNINFKNFGDDPLKPILVVTPIIDSKTESHQSQRWQINIIPCIADNTFNFEKLSLNKACIRHQADASNPGAEGRERLKATPFYNSSIRSDMLATSYLKLLHGASKSCEAFRDACLLGNTWLQQRGFGSDIHAGGFGNFEFSALMACLLQGGGPAGRPILNDTYSNYQLFKATVQLLAMRDFSKQPLIISSADETSTLNSGRTPVVWDAQRQHNVFYRMTPWSYRLLRQEARTTLNALADQNFDGFDTTFILKAGGLPYRYDLVVQLDAKHAYLSSDEAKYVALGPYCQLYDVLHKGLGDRAKCITIITNRSESWDLDATHHHADANHQVLVGVMTNAENASRTIDHGPPAEAKGDAAAFRKFWGDKAELRRFKDGSIQETLVWSGKENGPSVVEQICRHLVQKHVSKEAEQDMTVFGDVFRKLLPQSSANTLFKNAGEAFKQLENDVRSLEGLPLVVKQLMPADAQLRCSSITAPGTERHQIPANVVLQFEGSSRWPDDLAAIQRTKIAFLLKLREQLMEATDSVTVRLGLENGEHNVLNQAFLDIIYDTGISFRLRVQHDREQTLLERKLRDRSTDPGENDVAVLGLATYKRDYIRAPAHTQAVARLCGRFSALSGTIRLLKKWVASHLLENHIADEVIELMAARTFVQPWPWESPASVQTGFLRTLFWISRWDWKVEPLVVDLSGVADLNNTDIQSIRTKFEAWRKLDPALNRLALFAASNVDSDGITWTDGRPAKVVAGRMTALARAACSEIAEKELRLIPSALFESPLGDFDFVLRLDPVALGLRKSRKQPGTDGVSFKNLELELISDSSSVGSDPLNNFLKELDRLYGSAALFFSGGHERPVIAGLWNPQTQSRTWKLNLSYSTKPVKDHANVEMQANVNKEALLAEISRLGGNMIQSIEHNR